MLVVMHATHVVRFVLESPSHVIVVVEAVVTRGLVFGKLRGGNARQPVFFVVDDHRGHLHHCVRARFGLVVVEWTPVCAFLCRAERHEIEGERLFEGQNLDIDADADRRAEVEALHLRRTPNGREHGSLDPAVGRDCDAVLDGGEHSLSEVGGERGRHCECLSGGGGSSIGDAFGFVGNLLGDRGRLVGQFLGCGRSFFSRRDDLSRLLFSDSLGLRSRLLSSDLGNARCLSDFRLRSHCSNPRCFLQCCGTRLGRALDSEGPLPGGLGRACHLRPCVGRRLRPDLLRVRSGSARPPCGCRAPPAPPSAHVARHVRRRLHRHGAVLFHGGFHVRALKADARDDDGLEVHVGPASMRKVVVRFLPRLLHQQVCRRTAVILGLCLLAVLLLLLLVLVVAFQKRVSPPQRELGVEGRRKKDLANLGLGALLLECSDFDPEFQGHLHS
mmetsp:Transcript_9339/g.22908  ORF Transcript_9339/g.22908 Transcript_9339/m.22908 type:complete len:444 (+) Transcript_9339:638-1969(+)